MVALGFSVSTGGEQGKCLKYRKLKYWKTMYTLTQCWPRVEIGSRFLTSVPCVGGWYLIQKGAKNLWDVTQGKCESHFHCLIPQLFSVALLCTIALNVAWHCCYCFAFTSVDPSICILQVVFQYCTHCTALLCKPSAIWIFFLAWESLSTA